MKKKQKERLAYMQPLITVIEMPSQEHLLKLSGQHEDADNGGSFGDAKQGFFYDEEEEEITNKWGI